MEVEVTLRTLLGGASEHSSPGSFCFAKLRAVARPKKAAGPCQPFRFDHLPERSETCGHGESDHEPGTALRIPKSSKHPPKHAKVGVC